MVDTFVSTIILSLHSVRTGRFFLSELQKYAILRMIKYHEDRRNKYAHFNAWIFTNDLPSMLAEITGAEVVQNTRGGARLREQLNPETRLGAKALELLQNEKWDYVVLQEMSNGPITAKESFMQSVKDLCGKIRENGAVPVLYATWAYQKDGKQLQKFGIDYDEMYRKIHEAYAEAAEKNHTLLADVGSAFYEKTETENLFNDDGSHPNEAGSNLAAETIAEVILKDANA